MKKIVSWLVLIAIVCAFSSCAGAADSEDLFIKTEQTTETSDTTETEETTETTDCTDCSETTETTVDHPYGGTGGFPLTETTSTTEATDPADRYNLGMEYVMAYDALIIASGEEYEPYTSTIYYQNPYMVGDGILMFVSMENQLPHWIAEGVLPEIPLDADSDVRFSYHEDAELQHTGKFRIYAQDEDGRFYMAAELLESDLSEVYAYGKANLAGKAVYITYPFMLKYGDYSHLTDSIWGDQAVHDIMCIFKTTF